MASTATSDPNSHAGTLDLTEYIERANSATGNHPDSSRHYRGPTVHQYKFAIVGFVLGFSLVIVAIVLSSSSLQKSNEALALATANTEVIETEKLVYINNAARPDSLGTGSEAELDVAVQSDQPPIISTPSPTPNPTLSPTPKPTTAVPTSEAPTEPHPLNPQWFQTTHADYVLTASANEEYGTHSYHVAQLFCLRQNLMLCGYDAYCPNGPGSSPFRGGPPQTHNWSMLEETQWAPFDTSMVDAGTHWVQIGVIPASIGGTNENGFAKCWKYDDWTSGGGKDIEDFSKEEHRMWILCCDRSQ